MKNDKTLKHETFPLKYTGNTLYKNTICYSGSSQGIQVYNTCLFSILPEPISNTQMFIYFVYCILIIVHLLLVSLMCDGRFAMNGRSWKSINSDIFSVGWPLADTISLPGLSSLWILGSRWKGLAWDPLRECSSSYG
jgi:hypothetical protein